MAPRHLTQPTMLVAHRLMPSTLRFLVQRLELPRHALSLRLPFDNEPTVSSPPRVMREAEKGERAKPTLPALVALVTLWCTRGTNPRKTRGPAQSELLARLRLRPTRRVGREMGVAELQR